MRISTWRPVTLGLALAGAVGLLAIGGQGLLAEDSAAVAEPPAETAVAEADAPEEEGPAIDPAALQRLEAVVAYLRSLESSSVDLKFSMSVQAGGTSEEQDGATTIRQAGPGKFSLVPDAPDEGFLVVSDGEETLTFFEPLGRYTLTKPPQTLAGFLDSPLSRGLQMGFGRLALSMIDADALEKILQGVSAAKIVGAEAIDGVECDHLQLQSRILEWDVWVRQGAEPSVVRLVPNALPIMQRQMAAQGIEDIQFEMAYDYVNFQANGELPADAFLIVEPDEAELVESFGEDREAPHPLLGQPAPEFALANLAGEEVDLAAHLGKDVVILDFWATWCGPCVMALPVISEVATEYADKGVVFYAVNQQESLEQVQAFLEERELELPIVLDEGGEVAGKYSVEGLPTSVIIGKDGAVQVVHVGFSGALRKKLAAELDSLVAGENLAAAVLEKEKAREEARAALQAERPARNEARRKRLGLGG